MLHCRVCLAPAITPAAGRPTLCTVTLPGDTGSVGDVVPHRQQASSRIWRVARSRSAAPVTSRCTRSVAMHPIRRGAMATDRVHRYPQQVSAWRYASTPGRNTRQGSSTAIEETVHNRETHASDEAADSSTHQLLGHSTTRTICACQPLRSLRGDKRTISNLLRHTSSHGR